MKAGRPLPALSLHSFLKSTSNADRQEEKIIIKLERSGNVIICGWSNYLNPTESNEKKKQLLSKNAII